MRMEAGSDVFDFFYDSNGDPRSVKYNGTLYYYITNLQGDVVRIVNASGNSIGVYKYDAWGNILYQTDAALINKNPLRYRGYIYDTDTGFYYLQSRYYDPKIGRFLNADSYASTGQEFIGYNMYAYCNNSPVKYSDISGNMREEAPVVITDADVEAYFSGIIKRQNFKRNVETVCKYAVNSIVEDMVNFDIGNTDPQVVFDSHFISYYKGTFVAKTPFKASFSFGFIGLSTGQQDLQTLNHEYGHKVQLNNMGWGKYISNVAIPSITANVLDRQGKLPYDYYGSDWEAGADYFGDVIRTKDNTPWPDGAYSSYWDLIKLFF